MAPRKPVIGTEACIACGNCEAVCPEVFRLNENLGHSEVINPAGAPAARIRMPLTSVRPSTSPGRRVPTDAKTPMPFPPNYDNLSKIFRYPTK